MTITTTTSHSYPSDNCSPGVTLYELASGRQAWNAVSRAELLKARRGLELPCLSEIAPHVPAELAKIIMKACALRPGDRYPTAAELANVLKRFSETGRAGDRRRPERQDGQKYLRRTPLIVAAGVFSLAAAAWFAFSQPRQLPTVPEELLDVMRNGDIIGQIIATLPESAGKDTEANRADRERIADNLADVAERLLASEVHTDRDRERTRKTFDNLAHKYATGGITQEDLKILSEAFVKSPKLSLLASRLDIMETVLLSSDLSLEEKATVSILLNHLRGQCIDGTINPALLERLNRVVPGPVEGFVPGWAANIGRNDWPQLKSAFSQIQKLVADDATEKTTQTGAQ